MKPKITRTTGTVVLRTKAEPKPCTADWPKGDELDKLLRKWRIDMSYEPASQLWNARAWMHEHAPQAWSRTPLTAARKLARRLEKEAKG